MHYENRKSRLRLANLLLAVLLVGVGTTYTAADYGGEPLYCCGVYDSRPFVALPVELLGEYWECGDWVRVTTPGGVFWAQALDTGLFYGYHVEQWGNTPIVVDVPEHLWREAGISAPASVFNESLFNRLASDAKMGHVYR